VIMNRIIISIMSGYNELVVTIKEEEIGGVVPAKFYSKETLEMNK